MRSKSIYCYYLIDEGVRSDKQGDYVDSPGHRRLVFRPGVSELYHVVAHIIDVRSTYIVEYSFNPPGAPHGKQARAHSCYYNFVSSEIEVVATVVNGAQVGLDAVWWFGYRTLNYHMCNDIYNFTYSDIYVMASQRSCKYVHLNPRMIWVRVYTAILALLDSSIVHLGMIQVGCCQGVLRSDPHPGMAYIHTCMYCNHT